MATSSVSRAATQPIQIEPRARLVLRAQNISIDSIRVGKRLRLLGDIDALVESIRELGLLNPITVTRERRLVSGLHRLAAFKALGCHMIPAMVIDVNRDEAKLREIDENLARNDLTLLERAEHLRCRKEFYERLHPETRSGGDHGNQHTGGKKSQKDNLTFCQTAATSA
jgi:ParB family chromosome partitioning protein